MNDYDNPQNWGETMDVGEHLKIYKFFVRGAIGLTILIALVLVLMATWLT